MIRRQFYSFQRGLINFPWTISHPTNPLIFILTPLEHGDMFIAFEYCPCRAVEVFEKYIFLNILLIVDIRLLQMSFKQCTFQSSDDASLKRYTHTEPGSYLFSVVHSCLWGVTYVTHFSPVGQEMFQFVVDRCCYLLNSVNVHCNVHPFVQSGTIVTTISW